MEQTIEKIKAEIERLLTLSEADFVDGSEEYGYKAALRDVKNFINSLPEEPVSKDLEEAGIEWLRHQLDKSYKEYGDRKMMELTCFNGYAMLDAIEFGAQWQRNHVWHDARKTVPEDCTEQIICITEEGLCIVKIGKLASRTTMWAYLSDILPTKSE